MRRRTAKTAHCLPYIDPAVRAAGSFYAPTPARPRGKAMRPCGRHPASVKDKFSSPDCHLPDAVGRSLRAPCVVGCPGLFCRDARSEAEA